MKIAWTASPDPMEELMASAAAKCQALANARQGGSAPDMPHARYVVSCSAHDGALVMLMRSVWPDLDQAEAHAKRLRELPNFSHVVVEGQG